MVLNPFAEWMVNNVLPEALIASGSAALGMWWANKKNLHEQVIGRKSAKTLGMLSHHGSPFPE
jgi:hypothetical protein